MSSPYKKAIALLQSQNNIIGKATILKNGEDNIIRLEIMTYPNTKIYYMNLDELLNNNETTIQKN